MQAAVQNKQHDLEGSTAFSSAKTAGIQEAAKREKAVWYAHLYVPHDAGDVKIRCMARCPRNFDFWLS